MAHSIRKFICQIIIGILIFQVEVSAQHFKKIAHYTNENGLPQNSVKSIAIDGYGFVWMATEAGLVRYDGKNFKVFDKYNNRPITRTHNFFNLNDRLISLDEKSDQYEIINGRIQVMQEDSSSLEHVEFQALLQKMMMGFWQIMHYVNKHGEAEFLLKGTSSVKITKDSVIWKQHGKAYFGRNIGHLANANNMYFVIDGKFYCMDINHTGQFFLIDSAKSQMINIPGFDANNFKHKKVSIFENIASKQLFILLEDKLFMLKVDNQSQLFAIQLLSNENFNPNNLRSILYDESRQRLYIGSSIEGLMIYAPTYFSNWIASDRITTTNVFYTHLLHSENQIITGSGMLINFQDETFYQPAHLLNLPLPNISPLYKTIDGKYLSGNFDNIYFINENLDLEDSIVDFNPHAFGSIGNEFFTIGKKRNGEFGLYKILQNQYGKREIILINESVFINQIYSEDNYLYLFDPNGIYQYSVEKNELVNIQPLENITIRNIKKEGDIGYWLGTYEDGLYFWNGDTVLPVFNDLERYPSSIHAIQEDNNGYFWMSSNNGIYQFLKADLRDMALGNKQNIYYQKYTKEFGFSNNEFNGGGNHTSLKLPDGRLTFSSLNGIVSFHPDSIEPNFPHYPILIDEITLDGNKKDEWVNTNFDLHPQFDNIVFKLTTAQFGALGSVHFEYSLNGKHWVKMDGDQVSFNKLPKGQNTIRFRKLEDFSGKYTYQEISFNVIARWYETIWFYFGAVVLLTTLVLLILLFRERINKRINLELKKKVEERTQVLSMAIQQLKSSQLALKEQLDLQVGINETITHDIKTPLKYMGISVRKIKENLEKDLPPNIDEVNALHTSVNNIYQYTSTITENIKRSVVLKSKKMTSITDLLSQKMDIFHAALLKKNISVESNIKIDQVIINNVSLGVIIHNLLDNAIKNNEKSIIYIENGPVPEGWFLSMKSSKIIPQDLIIQYNRFFSDQLSKDEILSLPIGLGFKTIKNMLQSINATAEWIQLEDGIIFVITFWQIETSISD